METLQKNSETIDYLNKSLTEAQKFSFRALLANKQTTTQPVSSHATNFVPGQTNVLTARKFDEMRESNNFSRSRSRSPHELAGRSNSPLRVIERQRFNGGMMLNSNSFSNAKRNGGQYTPVHNYTPTMRESCAPGTANHCVDYTQPCECRDYQANLKVTNKYAERFGLTDNPQTTVPNSGRHQTSFGQNDPYLARVPYEPAKKEEKASHNKPGVRSQKSLNHEEPLGGHYYEDHNSNRYSQHNE